MSEEREQRNAVFAATAANVDPRVPTTAAIDKVKAEFNLDIPSELLPLPSGGKVYPVNSSLHGKTTLEVRPMTAREEDILTSRALLKKGTVITELIKSCLTDKSINPVDLLVGDRNALMVGIRVTGYGAEYEAEVECNECQTRATQQFNLTSLPIKPLELEPLAPGMNLFRFDLQKSRAVVHFRFLTGRDEEEILATQDRQKKLLGSSIESTVTTNLLYNIVSVNGVEDRAKIASFVRMLPALDSLALREHIKKHEPGIVMKQETVCPSCGHTDEVNMPMGVKFLWPSAG